MRQLCYQDQLCSESRSVTQRGWVESRLLPGGPCSSQVNQQQLSVPYLQTFKFYKFQVIWFIIQDNWTQEQRVQTSYC